MLLVYRVVGGSAHWQHERTACRDGVQRGNCHGCRSGEIFRINHHGIITKLLFFIVETRPGFHFLTRVTGRLHFLVAGHWHILLLS